jgi:molecular chaperone DnaJ
MDLTQAFAELGLPLHASQAEAKTAYRTLAMRWHPDIHGGIETENRMKSINVAYALVCRHLDALAKAASQRSGGGGAAKPAAGPASGFAEFDWKAGFRSAAQGAARPPEELVQRVVQVSLFEAAFGCVKRVTGMVPATCVRCGGSGEFPGTWTMGAKCMQCFGRGRAVQPGGAVVPCTACKGTGLFKPAPPPCSSCKGTGKTERRAWMVDLHIHAGTLNGCEVQGADVRVCAGMPAAPRNVRFKLQLEKHPLFKLDQDRLSVSVPVSFWRWTLGGEITVPTLEGSTRVSLAARPAALLVKNQGWPEPGAPNRRKPLFVMPRVIYPAQLDDSDRQLLQMLDARDKLPEVAGWERHVQAWLEASEPGAT